MKLVYASILLSLALPILAQSGCSTLPATINASNSKLNSPFVFLNGIQVVTKADFACRQQEISALFQRYELGTLPPKPQTVTGSYSGNTLTITVGNGGSTISFSVTISGNSGSSPVPAIIALGGSSVPSQSGVATITYNNNDIADQQGRSSRGRGKFYTLYGSSHSAGALIAWTWGISRILDALSTTTGHNIDVNRIGVTGCSRNGKGTYVATAFEPRIALGIVQESGSGGAGCWRISDAMLRAGTNTQTASQIVDENVWFSPNFNQYVNSVNNLPFDHHLLAALVAPRGLLIIENTSIDWLGPQSAWGCQTTGAAAYEALGVTDRMGITQQGNHDHCVLPSAQGPDVAAFVNRFLKGQSANTNIVKTDGRNNVGFVKSNWVDWSIPALSEGGGGSSSTLGPITSISSSTSVTSIIDPRTSTTPTTTASPPTQTKYGQCGGQSWNGPSVCVAGSTCTFINNWYSQCL
uniref:(4-O-methyl)-D-glucuronate--lignin esterase n=1 Tax=Psilocybe cubensis TaxID=181762 RepID=A0A8H8CF77_PSICU